jgi:uncharacterized GH25 family protein
VQTPGPIGYREEEKMKRRMKMFVPLLAAAVLFFWVMPAGAHLFWVETDADSKGSSVREVRVFLGHPDMPATNIVPELAGANVCAPNGDIAALTVEEDRDHQRAKVRLDQKGVYTVKTAREPGIFDPKWHNHEGKVRLTKDFAKLIMINGPVAGKPKMDAAMDFEIVPVALPQGLKKGDVFRGVVYYKGKPVRTDYCAGSASVNMHEPDAVQSGFSGKDGSFSVDLDKEGMWVVMVEYSVDETGVWDASHDLIYKGRTYYKKGERLPYGEVKYRSTLTFHVGDK